MLPTVPQSLSPVDLLQVYTRLDPHSMIMIEILALALVPLDQVNLVKVSRTVSQRYDLPAQGSPSHALATLIASGLAIRTSDGRHTCRVEVAADIAASAAIDERASHILSALSQARIGATDHQTQARLRVWHALFGVDPEEGQISAVLAAASMAPEFLDEVGRRFTSARSLGAIDPNLACQITVSGLREALMFARDATVPLSWVADYNRFSQNAYPFLVHLGQIGELMGFPGSRSPQELRADAVPRLKLLLSALDGDQPSYLSLAKKRQDRGLPRLPLEELLTLAAVMRFGNAQDAEKLLWDNSSDEGTFVGLMASTHFEVWGKGQDLCSSARTWIPEGPGKALLLGLSAVWLQRHESLEEQRESLTRAAADYRKGKALALAGACEEMARRAGGESPRPNFLVDAYRPVPESEKRFRGLLVWAGARRDASAAVTERMVWEIERHGQRWSVTPRTQKRSKSGGWSRGKALQLHNAAQKPPACCDDDDKKVLAATYANSARGGSQATIHEWALLSLVGHPRVFFADRPFTPVQVTEGRPALRVVQDQGQLKVRLEPKLRPGWTVQIHQVGPDRIEVVELSSAQLDLLKLLGHDWLEVPPGYEDEVNGLLETLASERVRLDSDLALSGSTTVPADPRLRLRLLPLDLGLAAEILVRPFADWGPTAQPGQGGKVMVAEREGETFQTERDLQGEEDALRRLREMFPVLAGDPLEIPSPWDCLELLEALRGAPEGLVAVEWPEGETFKIKWRADLKKLQIASRSEQNWLELEGSLAVSEEQVLSLQHLLELASGSKGRFLALGEGEYLALTQEFRDRLDQLALLGEPGKKGRLKLNALAATVVAPDLMVDEPQWLRRRQRMAEAEKLRPRIPAGFLAELRPYQKEGLTWLSRLAHWQAGACLADDMGLGKTIQALALLVKRAKDGPALVVAPTSVCPNWADEAARFAPGLRVKVLAEHDREQVLAAPSAQELVICSYGLLVNELERLEKVRWSTLILDEAQAIKNADTNRFKAAVALRADFRIATTGTPIENNLEELWSLFRFLNPGLLGSKKSFVTRFARPVSQPDSPEQETLRRLVHPFILRRLKNEVLQELPPKTEITLAVQLSEPEMALYEGLRREAVEAMASQPDNRLFVLLSHMMKLRRACCHPQLVMPTASFGSSKLEALLQLVGELSANGHRALVFSQFVDHLTLVRGSLDQLGVTYRYLDGSTSDRKRKEEIRAFQAGQGDLFLISLKAGGVGLNLTAADYVIHLDPWWNPAVEDQASDRAHRMGQLKPVTVYRLVASQTIEQKIVALHESKRDLADRLLQGTDKVTKLDAGELETLLRLA